MSDFTCLIGLAGCILLWILGLYLYPNPSQLYVQTVPEPWDNAPTFSKVSVRLSEWEDAVFGGEEE